MRPHSIEKPLAVVVGFVGKLPYAGMSLYNLHYVAGLHELGFEVHYVERQNCPKEYYDPTADSMTDDTGYAQSYLRDILPRYGIAHGDFSLIDGDGRCHGAGRKRLVEALERAKCVLNLADATWFEELELCPNRAFVDGDPMFTQIDMVADGPKSKALEHYGVLFTYGVRMGKHDCTVPNAGREWIPTRPVVATRLWDVNRPAPGAPVSCLMHWAAGGDVRHDGQLYGHKNRELERLIDLPRRSDSRFVLALGGAAPRSKIAAHGWELVNALDQTITIEKYQRFITTSSADLGVAKHAYVASRCGWFSDRSTCYLAAGRPVLHQDTGLGDWLPVGEGVLLFSDIEGLLVGLEQLEADYEGQARAARKLAETHFEARTIVASMLSQAGFR